MARRVGVYGPYYGREGNALEALKKFGIQDASLKSRSSLPPHQTQIWIVCVWKIPSRGEGERVGGRSGSAGCELTPTTRVLRALTGRNIGYASVIAPVSTRALSRRPPLEDFLDPSLFFLFGPNVVFPPPGQKKRTPILFLSHQLSLQDPSPANTNHIPDPSSSS